MSSSKLSRLGAKLLNSYRSALNRYPYIMQAVQVSTLMGTGDVFAQTLVEGRQLQQIDLQRTAKFFGLGFVLVGPVLRFWYGKLDQWILIEKPLRRTIAKVTLDQCCFAPIFLAVFTGSLSAIQGMNKKEIVQRLKEDYPDVLLTNYLLWPAAQLFNFRFVPLNYQVVYVQFVAIIWNTYLSAKLGE